MFECLLDLGPVYVKVRVWISNLSRYVLIHFIKSLRHFVFNILFCVNFRFMSNFYLFSDLVLFQIYFVLCYVRMLFVLIFVYIRGWVILINFVSHFVINVVLGLVDIRVKYYSYYFFLVFTYRLFLIKHHVVNYHPVFIVVIFIYLFYFILLDCILFYFSFIFGFFFVGPRPKSGPKMH